MERALRALCFLCRRPPPSPISLFLPLTPPPPFRFNRFLPDQSLWSCEVTEYKSACVDEWDMCRANGVAVIRAFRYLLLVPGEGGYLLLVYL